MMPIKQQPLDRYKYRGAMGTTDITDQGEWQLYMFLYTVLTKMLHRKHVIMKNKIIPQFLEFHDKLYINFAWPYISHTVEI